MTVSLAKIPSLQEVTGSRMKGNDLESKKNFLHESIAFIGSSLKSLAWLGYPASVYLSWVTVYSMFHSLLLSLLCMFLGFSLVTQFYRIKRRKRKEKKRIQKPATVVFEEIFLILDDAGYHAAAADARIVVRGATQFGDSRREFISIVDESLQYHLGVLTQASAMKARMGFGTHLSGLFSNWAGQLWEKQAEQVYGRFWPNADKELLRNIKKALSKGAKDIITGRDNSSGKNAELSLAYNNIEVAAQQSVNEIAHLRASCEEVFSIGMRDEVSKSSLSLRERLEREKKIQEELGRLKI